MPDVIILAKADIAILKSLLTWCRDGIHYAGGFSEAAKSQRDNII